MVEENERPDDEERLPAVPETPPIVVPPPSPLSVEAPTSPYVPEVDEAGVVEGEFRELPEDTVIAEEVEEERGPEPEAKDEVVPATLRRAPSLPGVSLLGNIPVGEEEEDDEIGVGDMDDLFSTDDVTDDLDVVSDAGGEGIDDLVDVDEEDIMGEDDEEEDDEYVDSVDDLLEVDDPYGVSKVDESPTVGGRARRLRRTWKSYRPYSGLQGVR